MFKKFLPIIFLLFFVLFFTLFLTLNVYGLNENEARNFASNTYLLNPLDAIETIDSATKIIYNQEDYWVLNTSTNQILIIQDKNDFVSDTTFKTILKTYLYFFNLEKYDTYELIDFYRTIPKVTDSFNYNLDLTKMQLQQNWPNETQLITGIINIQTRTKSVGELSIELAKGLNDLDKYYDLDEKNISNLNNISKNLESDSKKIIEELGLLDSSIFELKMSILDANISAEAKNNIGNSILILPKELENIPKYNSEIRKIYLHLNSMQEYSEEITRIDNLLSNWNGRIEKTIFLKPYFAKNDKIVKQQKLNSAKELFDFIIKDKSKWKNQEETNIFITKYNEMITDYENKNYKSAARQISALIDYGLNLIKQGYMDLGNSNNSYNNYQYNQNIEDEKPKINIFWIIAIALIIILIVVFVIDYVKKHKLKEKKKDAEINIDF